MKYGSLLLTFAVCLLFTSCSGECTECGLEDDANDTSSTEAPYPLKVCVVSGEALGSMGKPYVHLHEGATVKFCCKPCLKKFNEKPAEFLAKLK